MAHGPIRWLLRKTMAKYNADKPEVWEDLAHDFIEDADAADGKVWRYYTGIVKH